MDDRADDRKLRPHSSVAEYFHDVVSEAMRNQGVTASAHAEFYLVNLLSGYSHAPLCDQPLSLLLVEAREAEASVRLQKLRAIGDHALYVSGFFADSLENKLVDEDYYIQVGGSAYRSLSRSYSTPPWADTFSELSSNFASLVEVLAEVAAQTKLRTSSGMLKLYERYLRTGSRWAARRLAGMGMTGLPLTRKGGGGASA